MTIMAMVAVVSAAEIHRGRRDIDANCRRRRTVIGARTGIVNRDSHTTAENRCRRYRKNELFHGNLLVVCCCKYDIEVSGLCAPEM
jgi:hypothetical protein